MILMRYSTLLKKLVSPPGKVTFVSGTGTVTLPRRGFAGSIGETADKAALYVDAQGVVVIERLPVNEADHRTIKIHIAAGSSEVGGNEKAGASRRADGTIDGAESVNRRYFAGNNAVK